MWVAPESSRLPSRDELAHGKDAIAALEEELETLHATVANQLSRKGSIQERLKALRHELGQLDDEIIGSQGRISDVENEIRERSRWIAAIRRIPNEVLGEVFVWHVRLDWKAPLVDSSVCKTWRTVALATPRLWSFLRLSEETGFLNPQLAQLWVQRARAAPLHVHINLEDVTEDILKVYRDTYCLKFRPWPTRLQNHSFPHLSKLILDHEDATLDHLERDVFMAMPNLRYLHLHWRMTHRPIVKWNWDLPPLDEFHFAGATWAWIDAVEQVAGTLKKLALDLGSVTAPPPASIPIRTLNLPNLRYFAYGAQSQSLMINDAARVPIVTRILNAPSVEVFEDHSLVPLELPLPVEDNWQFPNLKSYLGQTSRELADVKLLYPNVQTIAFLVDPETGVLDVATLIDDASDGALDALEILEMFQASALVGHPMIEQALRRYREERGKDLYLIFHSGRDETPYQQCFFGFPCCYHQPIGSYLSESLVDGE
ncbi:hypothetical protein FRC14_001726 [Serendipita sp. 396]|nr:hypothetical protein FRC14_001726 [Serendipita sp. 396]KAG8783879.1 hypothetical protein FRC15_004346 [Serendipita sp. 397]KAG8799819.1 hypothetical protein FRC16_004293 [Serendipita sp. 398]KAG8833395.1 hypothetical protein FRC18_003697 [Serendipita sp. 400]KAG8848066.1 hypothetical protein FRB91_011206 [Serendipita sp. 411]KAG8869119.1 hypothetical protein FRC20_002083 [Serendipita sp. 405]KAG9053811.1 hypothetical protein FS842_007101 [Serendipita sp. 407]